MSSASFWELTAGTETDLQFLTVLQYNMLINNTVSETVLLLLEEKQNIWDNGSACCKTSSWRFSFLEKAILPLELV